jgi:hypothetical protein
MLWRSSHPCVQRAARTLCPAMLNAQCLTARRRPASSLSARRAKAGDRKAEGQSTPGNSRNAARTPHAGKATSTVPLLTPHPSCLPYSPAQQKAQTPNAPEPPTTAGTANPIAKARIPTVPTRTRIAEPPNLSSEKGTADFADNTDAERVGGKTGVTPKVRAPRTATPSISATSALSVVLIPVFRPKNIPAARTGIAEPGTRTAETRTSIAGARTGIMETGTGIMEAGIPIIGTRIPIIFTALRIAQATQNQPSTPNPPTSLDRLRACGRDNTHWKP